MAQVELAAVEGKKHLPPHGRVDHQTVLGAPVVAEHDAVDAGVEQVTDDLGLIVHDVAHQPQQLVRFQIQVLHRVLKATQKGVLVEAGDAQAADDIAVRMVLRGAARGLIPARVGRVRQPVVIVRVPAVAERRAFGLAHGVVFPHP